MSSGQGWEIRETRSKMMSKSLYRAGCPVMNGQVEPALRVVLARHKPELRRAVAAAQAEEALRRKGEGGWFGGGAQAHSATGPVRYLVCDVIKPKPSHRGSQSTPSIPGPYRRHQGRHAHGGAV